MVHMSSSYGHICKASSRVAVYRARHTDRLEDVQLTHFVAEELLTSLITL